MDFLSKCWLKKVDVQVLDIKLIFQVLVKNVDFQVLNKNVDFQVLNKKCWFTGVCCTGDICEWNLILSKAINRKDLPSR